MSTNGMAAMCTDGKVAPCTCTRYHSDMPTAPRLLLPAMPNCRQPPVP